MWNIDSTIRLMRELSLSADADELMQVFARHVRETASVDRALIIDRAGLSAPQYRVARRVDFDPGRGRFVESQPGLVRRGGLLSRLLDAGELNLVNDLSVPPTDPGWEFLSGQRSLMAFPVFDRGIATGALILLGAGPQACSQPELWGLAMMAGLLDRAIHTHALVARLEATCRALDRELATAADVQRWLLPSALPVVAGVSVATSYRTAQRSGGDYYDVVELPDGRIGLLIADVSGQGAPAAVLVAVVRTIVHLERSRWSSPAALLHELNRDLCDLVEGRGAFVTAFCAVLDPGNGRLVYSSAGHLPPRRIGAADSRVTGLGRARSGPLGIDGDMRFAEADASLGTGDVLLLYTDGITEARSAEGELFGDGRLDAAVRGPGPAATAEGVVGAALAAVEEFSGPAARPDDQTLVAVKWEGRDSGRPGTRGTTTEAGVLS